MKRNIYKQLEKWKLNKKKKPLIITGARQVGKTYIVKEFGENEYNDFLYLNLMEDKSIKEIFDEGLSPDFVFEKIMLLKNVVINNNTLVVIDEIQENVNALNFLKFLNESKEHENNVIATGSWIDAAIEKNKTNYPVGQVERIQMHTLSIDEFILNTLGQKFVDVINDGFKNKKSISNVIHNKLMDQYQLYLFIGGMPEIVAQYIDDNKTIVDGTVKTLLKTLRKSYISDLSKYSKSLDIVKMNEIYNSIPVQLSKTYNKFKYSIVKKGTQKNNYVNSLDMLNVSRVTIPTYEVKKPRITLEGEYNMEKFKLYMSDSGFLTNLSNLSFLQIKEGKFSSLGWITENFVAIHLNMFNDRLFYWYKEPFELDFLITTDRGIIPIDVKSGRRKRSTSMKRYCEKTKPPFSIIISKENFSFSNGELNIPLYAVFILNESFTY